MSEQQGRNISLPSVEKLTEWTKEPGVMDLKDDLSNARGAHDAHIMEVKKWNDLRNVEGNARPKTVKGRSSVQPKLIRRQAEWRYSALSEPFLSSDKIYDISPVTFEDAHAAEQNELVLNWQFRTKLNRVKFIDEYVRTAVDEGTAIVRLGWDRQTRMQKIQVPVYMYMAIESEEEAAQLEAAMQLKELNPREYSEEVPPAIQAAVDYYLETGQMSRVIQTGMEDDEEEEILVNEPTLDILDPENVWIDPSCRGDINKAKFVIVSFETSKAELMKDGRYKNLTAVNWSGNTVLSQPDHATQTPTDFTFKDDLRRPVVAYEYWGYYDVDGTEELKPIVATWIGDVMIRMEENPFPDQKLPFVVVPYLPKKRRVHGEPDAEILEDNQKILGAVTRGMIDLMGRSANSQTGTAKGFLDVTNKRRFEKGEDYEYNPGTGDPRISIFQHQYPEIPNSAITMVNLQNQEAEALSGVKAFSGGLSGEAYGDVAAGIKGMLDASSKREMNILRRLAKGMQEIGVKIMAMNAVFLSEEETIRVTNRKFITVRREDLKGNFDLKVDISTPEVDQNKAQDLGFMLQTLGPDMDPAMRQMILSEIAKLKRMPELAEKLERYEPKPDPFMEEMKKLEMEKLKKEIEKIDSEIAYNMSRAQKAETEADLNNLEFIEEETGTKHARDMQKIEGQARGNQDLEVTKALVKPGKPEERRPDVEAAIGYNRMSEML